MRRRSVLLRPEARTSELPGGWLCGKPGGDGQETPSYSIDRIYWFDPDRPIGPEEVAEAVTSARNLDLPRVFVWLSPWVWTDRTERALTQAGGRTWPFVDYVALARAAAAVEPPRPCKFTTRRLAAPEVAGVLSRTAPWFPTELADFAERLAGQGITDVYASFSGSAPAAVGLVTRTDSWAYLGPAFTDPAFRGRGAQSALIAARVSGAAAAGSTWVASETNSMVPISLRNLQTLGFVETVVWRVLVLDLPTA